MGKQQEKPQGLGYFIAVILAIYVIVFGTVYFINSAYMVLAALVSTALSILFAIGFLQRYKKESEEAKDESH